ncbi:MAG: DUF488 domain-containing protein [Clostridia bacterium]|nr:DUF488 domain-containing protein [Clostridia bacterium]
MKGKVYTTYLANMKNAPNEVQKIIVSRYLPKRNLGNEIIHMIELAPSKNLLFKYKNNQIDYPKFAELYLKEIWNSNEAQNTIKFIKDNYLDQGKSICFICYEKQIQEYHRFLTACEFIKLGYDWEEI